MRCRHAAQPATFLTILLTSCSLAWSQDLPFSCEHEYGLAKPDADLHHFITRPDLRAPIFNVSIHDKQKTGPGLLFVAPYAETDGHRPRKEFRTAQVGPHIYDLQGDLIWSGAALFSNRPTHDFRATLINGKPHLSFLHTMWPDECIFPKGAGIILDDSYQLTHNVTFEGENVVMDLHEFKIIDNGRSALVIGQSTIPVGSDDLNPEDLPGPRRDHIPREIDLNSRETLFEWSSKEVIADSVMPYPERVEDDWDYMHANSVEKTRNGDFLISARHTNTIYLISGKDNSILWRLGGKNSSFNQGDFIFSGQHDARILSEDPDSHSLVISFLNNAYAGILMGPATADVSSVVVVALDTSAMTTKVLESLPAPDGLFVGHAGNAQFLDNGNRFVNWVEAGHVTEHAPTGEVLYEAKWLTDRYHTYRAFKMDFVAQPKEKPVLKSFASAIRNGKLATMVYVSWNGATEVRAWRVRDSTDKIIGEMDRTGFETLVVCEGFHETVRVEALDSNGGSLTRSEIQLTELPPSWESSPVSEQQHGGLPWSSIITLVIAFFVGALSREACSRWLRKGALYNILHGPRFGYSKVEQTAIA